MPLEKLGKAVSETLSVLSREGRLKGAEDVITGVVRASGNRGPRYLLEGSGAREFIKMDSNSYLGLHLDEDVIKAGEDAAARFGAGPGSVRFIHGTYAPHAELEKKLAAFHRKEEGIIFSSAYAAVCGVIAPLVSPETAVVSDELNHNSIINALRMSKPKSKKIFRHLDMDDLRLKLEESTGNARRLLIITDGVFSMRGDYPDLGKIASLAGEYDERFDEGVAVVMDDSHGVGAYGGTGRGTEEFSGNGCADIIVSTLGKSLGVNGGYAVSSRKIISLIRESSPLYVYSNPVTPGEAGAALKALEILEGDRGGELLSHLKNLSGYFKRELRGMGYEVVESEHPVTAVMVRDRQKTAALVAYLRENGILAVGIKYPVVPEGDECVRFQVNASHTEEDIAYVLDALGRIEPSRVTGRKKKF